MSQQKYLDPIQWGFLMAEAWSDPGLRERLERDPTRTIQQYAKERFGLEVERAFQVPSPPADLTAETLSASVTGSLAKSDHAGPWNPPGTGTGSGTGSRGCLCLSTRGHGHHGDRPSPKERAPTRHR